MSCVVGCYSIRNVRFVPYLKPHISLMLRDMHFQRNVILRPKKKTLSKIIKIEVHRNTILPVILYERETWSLTSREERRLRVFENRVVRRILGSLREEWHESGENYITRNFKICTAHPILFRWSNREKCHDCACSTYGGDQKCMKVLVVNQRKRDHLEYPCVDRRIILKWIVSKWDGRGIHILDWSDSEYGQLAWFCE